VIGRGTLLWLALAIVAGVGLFQVSYRVQSLEDQLTRVNRQILAERDTIHLLNAEWSYLNEPTRLAELAQRHLNLTPLAATQMVAIEDLALRLPPLVAETAPLPVAHTPAAANDHAAAETHPAAPPAKLSAAEPPPTSITDLINRTSTE
jgi:cell division protein FtsL